jgi:hypothetical protein
VTILPLLECAASSQRQAGLITYQLQLRGTTGHQTTHHPEQTSPNIGFLGQSVHMFPNAVVLSLHIHENHIADGQIWADGDLELIGRKGPDF